ncbi:GNAT family N-acetyltransferase [Undibacterium sp. TJN19]|uniref:GNAT family N-acetyltransferase n=1 Tax=Undibacterium sp. TJN19 TaxID=3413055 RepID=UPI003BF14362
MATSLPYELLIIPIDHLHDLASSVIPATLAYTHASNALPPAFVAARALAQIDAGASAYWCSTFYVLNTDNAHIVGSCGFKSAPQAGCVEIGYGISAECRKLGAASAAVQYLLQLAFDGGAEEVLATVNPDNLASTRVVQKLGFLNCGTFVDEQQEPLVHWVAHRPAPTV